MYSSFIKITPSTSTRCHWTFFLSDVLYTRCIIYTNSRPDSKVLVLQYIPVSGTGATFDPFLSQFDLPYSLRAVDGLPTLVARLALSSGTDTPLAFITTAFGIFDFGDTVENCFILLTRRASVLSFSTWHY